MANRERGEQRLIAGAQTFTLRLTLEACLEVEDRAGKSLDDLIAGVNRGSVRALRWLLWASLQAKHAETIQRPDDVGAVMDAVGTTASVLKQMTAFLLLNADDRPKEAGSKEKRDTKRGWAQLYTDARCLGLTSEQFWALSLKELWRELAVAEQRIARERDRDVTMAWMMGAFCGFRKMPSLASVLKKTGPRQARQQQTQTWQEMKAAMKAITQGESHGAR